MTTSGIYDQGLPKTAANFVALSPVSFVERSAEVFGDLPAVIHGQRRSTWKALRDRSIPRLSARGQGIGVRARQAPQRQENVLLGGVGVQQRHHFYFSDSAHLALLRL